MFRTLITEHRAQFADYVQPWSSSLGPLLQNVESVNIFEQGNDTLKRFIK